MATLARGLIFLILLGAALPAGWGLLALALILLWSFKPQHWENLLLGPFLDALFPFPAAFFSALALFLFLAAKLSAAFFEAENFLSFLAKTLTLFILAIFFIWFYFWPDLGAWRALKFAFLFYV